MDVSAQLPELIRRPGLTSWIPAVDKTADRLVNSWQEFSALMASSSASTSSAPASEVTEEAVVGENTNGDKEDLKPTPTLSLNTKLTEGHWPPPDAETLNLHRWCVLYFYLKQE